MTLQPFFLPMAPSCVCHNCHLQFVTGQVERRVVGVRAVKRKKAKEVESSSSDSSEKKKKKTKKDKKKKKKDSVESLEGCLRYTLEDERLEPTNHPFRKENELPNLHDYVLCLSSGV